MLTTEYPGAAQAEAAPFVWPEGVVPLRNDRVPDPDKAPKREQEWHRVAIYLRAQGMSFKEIAARLGKTWQWVSNVIHQPEARVILLQEIRDSGKSEIEALLKGVGSDCLLNLKELADTAKSEGVRVAANNSLLDRVMGKAVQHVETTATNVNISCDLAELDAQIKELEKQEARLMGHGQVEKN
jgi:transcriptional regulator